MYKDTQSQYKQQAKSLVVEHKLFVFLQPLLHALNRDIDDDW
jgi:hypothetical protein